MLKNKIKLLVLLSTTILTQINGQELISIGIRSGNVNAITASFPVHNQSAEIQLGFWNSGYHIRGLVQNYRSTSIPNVYWYSGLGAHLSSFENYSYTIIDDGKIREYQLNYPRNAVGVDGVIGAEWQLSPPPFSLGISFIPYIEISNTHYVYSNFDTGIHLKFLF